ncbi:lamin tail domain-containing protein [Fibrobacterota bacterium]
MKLYICIYLSIMGLFFSSCTMDSTGSQGDDAPILINEFMASNQTDTILDEGGNAADWIELYNNSDDPYNLKGLYLSDDSTNVLKFALPDVEIPARGHHLLWADDDEEMGPNHVNFKLSATDGEEIILSNGDSETIDRIIFYDNIQARQTNYSYGRTEDGSPDWDIQSTPTPEQPNTTD